MFFWFAARRCGKRPSSRPTARPCVEALESRLAPYAATGNAWLHPQLVTISIIPDGTVEALGNGGQITSNLFATLNNIPGITSPSQWQSIILKAAQTWAAQTNVSFAMDPDDGSQAGSGAFQQGAPNFGDIRIGGYNFGSGCSWLASTFYPPSVNNYSVAGDVAFNTSYGFNIGSTYDLFSVASHEIGHALGLACSSSAGAVMFTTYNGAVAGLGSDDVAGIRSVYSGGSARSTDAYGGDNSFATAANITSAINTTSLTAVLNNLSITSVVNNRDTVTSADVAYYKFTAPSKSAATMSVSVQSAGLSLLSPMMTVYAANQTTVLGTANGKGQYGTTLTLSGIAVMPGATYYVKVQGADTSVFGTGAYALTLNLGTGANPTVTLPNTQFANGNPVSAGGGVPLEPATNPSAGAALYGITIAYNFNGTPISAGDTVWFSSVAKVSGLKSAPATLYVTGASIAFTADGTSYCWSVPNAVIALSPTAVTATTTFNASANYWETIVPSNLGGNVFLAGFAMPVPVGGLPGGIKSVAWQAQFESDTPGLSVNWQWAAAVYSQFGADYTAVGIKPVDDNRASPYQNSDQAGTPEAFKDFVVGGAGGGGGANFTGGHSGTAGVLPPMISPTASLSGSVVNGAGWAGLAGVTLTLTGTTAWGQSVTLTTTTNTQGSYTFSGLSPGTYSIMQTPPDYFAEQQSMLGSLGGTLSANQFLNINLTPGYNGSDYGFVDLTQCF